jgi:hypothetical protein
MAYTHYIGNTGGSSYRVDADLDNVHVLVDKIPTVNFGEINTHLKEMPRIEFGAINSSVSIKELPRIDLTATTTSTVNVAITQIPDVRAHLPAHYKLGIAIFGVEIVSFSLCGESQVITEKYVPRRMELCG